MTAKKTKAQRELERAVEQLRKPGARLLLMYATRKDHEPAEKYEYFIIPGGPVRKEIAAKLIERPDVCAGKDGLFPGHDQTWRFA